ncbi:hypothetical protein [Streptomyces sp. NPDC051636]|uniref:hypothetical protein n=1 Tax=Streptomyces sp. NPDC051636 TaxID=3365663 RepID=UPI003787AD4C
MTESELTSEASGRCRRTDAGERIDVDAVLPATGAAVPRRGQEYGVALPDAPPVALLVRAPRR